MLKRTRVFVLRMRIDLNITILRHNLSTNKPVFGPALSVNSLWPCVKFNVAMFTH